MKIVENRNNILKALKMFCDNDFNVNGDHIFIDLGGGYKINITSRTWRVNGDIRIDLTKDGHRIIWNEFKYIEAIAHPSDVVQLFDDYIKEFEIQKTLRIAQLKESIAECENKLVESLEDQEGYIGYGNTLKASAYYSQGLTRMQKELFELRQKKFSYR